MRYGRFGFGAAAVAVTALAAGVGAPGAASAQGRLRRQPSCSVATGYSLTPNVTYHRAGGRDLTLDVYRPRGAAGPNPTLIYIHGGGWTNGSKEASALTFLPYLEMGWSVVNVAYRLADAAHAPAAVEDCRCALRWVYRNAERMGFDDRPDRGDRQLGRRAPGADDGHAARVGGPRPAVPRRPAPGLDDGTRRRPRRSKWPPSSTGTASPTSTTWPTARRGPPGTSPRRGWAAAAIATTCQARLAHELHPRGSAADPHHPRRPGLDRPLRPRDAAARGARRGGRGERAGDDRGRRPRRLQPRENQRIYAAIRAFLGEHGLGARAVERLGRRQSGRTDSRARRGGPATAGGLTMRIRTVMLGPAGERGALPRPRWRRGCRRRRRRTWGSPRIGSTGSRRSCSATSTRRRWPGAVTLVARRGRAGPRAGLRDGGPRTTTRR